jgi:probable F420-dependent oxidoreductase
MPGFPFRFGLHLSQLPAPGWAGRVRRYERLGFSAITLTDHLVVPQWEPLAALAAIGAATDRIGLGTLVLDMALRNPVLTAKSAATIELLSGGRLELGVGAGYLARNFAAAGLPFEPPADRVARLEEAVALLRQLWTQPSTTMRGRFFAVADSPMVAAEPVSPRLLVGGGGRRMMRLGGRVADTVSMIARQTTGEWSVAGSLPDSTLPRMAQKAAWVREGAAAAGRDPATIELGTMVAKTVVGADPAAAIAAEAAASGVSPAQMADTTLYLCGTGAQVRDQLGQWRERAGISYVSLFDPGEEQISYLAEHVIGPLAGATPTPPS